jgi:alpha-L-fucosidase
MKGVKMRSLIVLLLVCLFACTQTQTPVPEIDYLTESQQDRDLRMAWWRDARFGMFIHWGLYAIPAGIYDGKKIAGIGEWIMQRTPIPVTEYEKFAAQFNPVKFDADEWVSIAKNAGMKYIVITSKHHDGFCLWDSKITEWDIMDASPFKRDVLQELATACQKQGIQLCFYHSIMDWHHPDAQSVFYPNYNDREKSNPDFPRYVENYLKPQLKELIEGYGPLGILWFDGEWIKDWTTAMGKDMYNYVRNLQPNIIINNRVDKGRQGMQGLNKEGDFAGDYGTPEQEIPPTGVAGLDWESCMTMNDTWGFKSWDHNWKSDETLIHNLIDISSKGGNFLLNVGPTAEGLIPGESVARLQAMGRWMEINAQAVYGTTASPYDKPAWGRYTQKPGTIFAHVFDWPKNRRLQIPPVEGQVKKVSLLADKYNSLKFSQNEKGIAITLPREAPDKIASVVAIEY